MFVLHRHRPHHYRDSVLPCSTTIPFINATTFLEIFILLWKKKYYFLPSHVKFCYEVPTHIENSIKISDVLDAQLDRIKGDNLRRHRSQQKRGNKSLSRLFLESRWCPGEKASAGFLLVLFLLLLSKGISNFCTARYQIICDFQVCSSSFPFPHFHFWRIVSVWRCYLFYSDSVCVWRLVWFRYWAFRLRIHG